MAALVPGQYYMTNNTGYGQLYVCAERDDANGGASTLIPFPHRNGVPIVTRTASAEGLYDVNIVSSTTLPDGTTVVAGSVVTPPNGLTCMVLAVIDDDNPDLPTYYLVLQSIDVRNVEWCAYVAATQCAAVNNSIPDILPGT